MGGHNVRKRKRRGAMHARGLQRSGDRRRISHAPDRVQRYELERRDPHALHPDEPWRDLEPWATLEGVALSALERLPAPSIADLVHECGYLHLSDEACPDELTARAWYGDR